MCDVSEDLPEYIVIVEHSNKTQFEGTIVANGKTNKQIIKENSELRLRCGEAEVSLGYFEQTPIFFTINPIKN